MKRAAFFFGAGISRASGKPLADDITQAALSGDWHLHTDQNFYPGLQFDSGTPGPGVRTHAEVGTGGNTNWFLNASTVTPLARVTAESANNLLRTIPATGISLGADRVEADLNGVPFGPAVHPGWADNTGAWSIDLPLPAGENLLTVRAIHPSGWISDPASSTFTVTGQPQTITTTHDQVGNVITRTWSGGKSQALTWDAENRLIKLVQSGGGETAFTWTATYDALGRRLTTTYTPNGGDPFTTKSIYDPLVTHLEIGLTTENTEGTETYWKVHGPDLNGSYGGLHGTGGLEWIVSNGQATGILSDTFGHAIASISDASVTWHTTKVGAYGPLPTSRMLTLESGASLAEATAWRGNRIDPTGFIQLGVRPYDPAAGRFLAADPFGHEASMSLYCFANGDPINFHDPDGYLAVGAWNLTTSVLGNPYVQGGLKTVGGGVQVGIGVAGGIATSWTGVGAVAGGVTALHGLDTFQSGVRQLWTGQQTRSLTAHGLTAVSGSQSFGDVADAGLGMVFSFGTGALTRTPSLASDTIRVSQFYNPTRGAFGPSSSTALATRPTIADLVVDGSRTPQTWVAPNPAHNLNWFERMMTGRGSYRHFVEFSVGTGELQAYGGIKALIVPPATGLQAVIPGTISLTNRAPVFGALPYNYGQVGFMAVGGTGVIRIGDLTLGEGSSQ